MERESAVDGRQTTEKEPAIDGRSSAEREPAARKPAAGGKACRAGQLLLGLVLMLLILSVSVVATLNFRPLYYWEMERMDLAETSGLTEEQIRRNYDVLIDYNNLWGPDTLEFPDLPMSEGGRVHFEEVKRVFLVFEYLIPVSLVLAAAGILYFRRRGQFRYLKYGALLTVLVPLAAGLAIAANWDRAFVLFHQVVFRNDLWIFDPAEDPVITILPDTFFLHCAVMIVALALLGSILCGLLYARKAVRAQRKKENDK